MFHIGIAVQHPPLPDPSQLSELGIDFIRQCLTIDADARPTAFDLMNHPWIVELEERVNLAFEDEMGPATNSGGSSGSMNTSSGGSMATSGGGSMNT
jgi:mitogen-activated protein kinase kinase kinase